jgi:hypothetical protein
VFYFGDGDWAEGADGRENMKNTDGGYGSHYGCIRPNGFQKVPHIVVVHVVEHGVVSHVVAHGSVARVVVHVVVPHIVTHGARGSLPPVRHRLPHTKHVCHIEYQQGWIPFVILPGITKLKVVKKDIPVHLAKLELLGNPLN